jgi:hypothetical protein
MACKSTKSMPYILKSDLVNSAKFSYLKPILTSYVDNLATDQDGYIQHPLDAQVGIDPDVKLSTLIASFILGINEIKNELPDPAIKTWYNSKVNNKHVWNPEAI